MQKQAHPAATNGRVLRLQQELETFQAKLPELLTTDAGRYVLIHGGEVIRSWETWGEAVDAAYERFGLEPFLVKQVVRDEQSIYVSRDVL
jgi:hypothetical protein